MKEFIEKLIERLEEYPHGKYEDEYGKGFSNGINVAIEEVNELAEEYINTSTDTSTTNADRIRSMTDEELAVFLCKVKADYQWITQDFPREDECDEWVIWLQSEVEGVTENE